MSTTARFSRLPAGAVMVRLTGELDLASAAALQAYLRGAIHLSNELVLDMRGVEFLDCASLGVLVWARNQVIPAGGSLVLVAPTGSVSRLIEVAGMNETFRVRGELDVMSA